MSKVQYVRAFSAGGVVVRRTARRQDAVAQHHALSVSPDGALAPLAETRAAPAALAESSASAPAPLGVRVEVALVGFVRENMWVLPKGTPDPGETPEQTALREVQEETGLDVRIVGAVGSISYTFARRGVRFDKEVMHYLMEAIGGDVTLHDHEYDEARWFTFDEALRRLRHKNEADVLVRAEPLIRVWLDATPPGQ